MFDNPDWSAAMTGAVGRDNSNYQPPPLLNSMEVLTAIAQNNITPGSGGSLACNVVISPFGELIVALIQMQMQNAQIFKQTAAEAAARIQDEAKQKAAAESKQFLTQVANALQEASQTGKLPQLPTQPTLPIQAYSRTGQPVTTNPISSTPSTIGIDLGQLFSTLASQIQEQSTQKS